MRTALAAGVLGAATLGSGAPLPAVGQEAGHLDRAPCELEGVTGPAECGTLTVWEDRDGRTGRAIDLYFVLLPPTDPDPEPDPIYFLVGGPGQGAASTARGWSRSPRRARRAIVLMDQRGTGKSNVLNCLHDEAAPVEAFLGQLFDPDHIAACRAELERHADLTRYTSPASLDDLDDLRAALGHESINLIGGSYGTRAALVYIRRHGQHVRSATLEAAMSLAQTMPEGMARDAEAAIRGVLRDCADSPPCAESYPDLEREYTAVVERSRRPMSVTIRDPRDNREVETVLQPAGFGEALRAMLYDPGATRRIPELLHAAATEEDFDGFASFGANRTYRIERAAATGLYLSVTCAEDIPFASEAAEYEQGAGTFLADSRARSHFEACRRWPRGSVPDDFHDHVASDVPVLVISGTHDPVTPPRYGADAARFLSRSIHVIVPHGHHDWGALENASDCVGGIEDSFLEDPLARADLSCLETIRRRPFTQ